MVARTPELGKLEAVRQVAQEVDRLDTEGIAGLTVRGLGSEHLYATRLPRDQRWERFGELTVGVSTAGWREVLTSLGYQVSSLPKRGYLATADGEPVLVVHPRKSADQFARLDDAGRLPEGALVADCLANGAPYGLLAVGVRMRLLRARRDDAGTTTRYLELDPASMEPDYLPLLGILAPGFLAVGGLEELLVEARDYGSELRKRLDRSLRQDVLPALGRELGRWAQANGRDVADDGVRAELESAALTWVFRALFLLYAESAGHLPTSNHTYAGRSFTRIAERAAEELDVAVPNAKALWRDVVALVDAMRTGQSAWGVPAYNDALFAPDGFDGAEILEAAYIADAQLAPALVALARDADDHEFGVDFSGLEIGHLGHIYEGLLSLRLSVADGDFRYDLKSDRYVAADSGDEIEVVRGDLLWLTNEGGRKGGGVYYTRTELVRHLVREAVRPAFERHLAEVRELAAADPRAAAGRLFEFFVLDPACGSAHFLVEVVEELADQIATLLGELALPAVREALDALRAAASSTFGAGIEDTATFRTESKARGSLAMMRPLRLWAWSMSSGCNRSSRRRFRRRSPQRTSVWSAGWWCWHLIRSGECPAEGVPTGTACSPILGRTPETPRTLNDPAHSCRSDSGALTHTLQRSITRGQASGLSAVGLTPALRFRDCRLRQAARGVSASIPAHHRSPLSVSSSRRGSWGAY